MIYMLEGVVGYRHGQSIYRLEPGDTLFFDADAPHGPEKLDDAADPLSVGDFLFGSTAHESVSSGLNNIP
jgi:uncharacterized cupin superfamily protein